MANKKIKFLGITIYKEKNKGSTRKRYFLGICYNKKKYQSNLSKNISNAFPLIVSYPKTLKMLKIAIAEGGGIGDSLFQLTYIKEIRKLVNCPVIIDFYCRAYKTFENIPFIDHTYPYQEGHPTKDDYDLYIVSRRFYIICKMDDRKVQEASATLYEFCKWCKNLTDNVLCGEFQDNLFNQYALLFRKNRLEQANVGGLLPIDRNTPKFLNWEEDAFSVLSKNHLLKAKYITICRAVDSKYNANHPKLWLLPYYNELVAQIKKNFPKVKIVQIGSSKDFGTIEGVDVDLLGKTTLDETKVLLKNSLLHIDGEGGLVHMKKFLNGRSVVIFGPTSPDVFGYEDNMNLRSTICPRTCEWVHRNWTQGCMLGEKIQACMKALTSNIVFQEVQKILGSISGFKFDLYSSNSLEVEDLKSENKVAYILRNDEINEEFIFKNSSVVFYDENLSKEDEYKSINTGYIDYAKKWGFNAEYGSPYNIPLDDLTQDIVYCDQINCINYPKFFVKEATRILKKGGKLILKDKGITCNTEMFSLVELSKNKVNPEDQYIILRKK